MMRLIGSEIGLKHILTWLHEFLMIIICEIKINIIFSEPHLIKLDFFNLIRS